MKEVEPVEMEIGKEEESREEEEMRGLRARMMSRETVRAGPLTGERRNRGPPLGWKSSRLSTLLALLSRDDWGESEGGLFVFAFCFRPVATTGEVTHPALH